MLEASCIWADALCELLFELLSIQAFTAY